MQPSTLCHATVEQPSSNCRTTVEQSSSNRRHSVMQPSSNRRAIVEQPSSNRRAIVMQPSKFRCAVTPLIINRTVSTTASKTTKVERQRDRHETVTRQSTRPSRTATRNVNTIVMQTATQPATVRRRHTSMHAYDKNEEETWAADLWRCLRFVDRRAAHSNWQQNLSENHQPNTSAVPVSDAFGQSVLSKAALPVALRATPSPGQ
jgi:hypothetical protein